MRMDTAGVEVGTRVAYEDMANPRREGIVAAKTDTRWGIDYTVALAGLDGGVDLHHTTLRQPGWTLATDSIWSNR